MAGRRLFRGRTGSAGGRVGETDLLVRVVGAGADGLYRIAGQVPAIPGVERANTALVMGELVSFCITPGCAACAQRTL